MTSPGDVTPAYKYERVRRVGWVGNMYFQKQLDDLTGMLARQTSSCFVTDNSLVASTVAKIRSHGPEYTVHRACGLNLDIARTWYQQQQQDELERMFRQGIHTLEHNHPRTELTRILNLKALLEWSLGISSKLADCASFNLSLLRGLHPKINTVCHKTSTSTVTVWTSVPVLNANSTESSEKDGGRQSLKRTRRIIAFEDD